MLLKLHEAIRLLRVPVQSNRRLSVTLECAGKKTGLPLMYLVEDVEAALPVGLFYNSGALQ